MLLLRKASLFGLGIALLFDRTANACSCIALYLEPCEQAAEADVVVLATAVSRAPVDGNGGLTLPPVEGENQGYTSPPIIDPNLDVIYTLDVQALYQGDVDPTEPLTFTTCGNSACCGIYLEIGQEYIVGLYGDNDDLFGQSCGLFIGNVTEDDKRAFEECEEDPCNGTCGDNQECIYFEEEYVCADTTCDPSPCADNEFCNVEKWACTQEPCPTIAFCSDACNGECGEGEVCELTDEVACIQQPCPPLPQCVPVEESECDIECGEYQNCLLFDQPDYGIYTDGGLGGREGDWWYCADFCDPGRCDEGQVCELLPTPCAAGWVPCPLVAVCYDQCSEGCEANEECVFYPNEGYVCAVQSCDPNPCAEGEACTIFESFPPIVECTPADRCDGRCTEFQECLIYTHSDESEEAYCADTCAPGRCDPEGCVLAEVPCDEEPCPPVAECTNGCLDCKEGEECANYPGIGYTCAFQSCDPSPCAEDETCVLQETSPPLAVCLPEEGEGECDVPCEELQECLLFERPEVEEITGDWWAPSLGSEWYCQDVCSPERCDDGEVCELLATPCPGPENPCPLVAVCTGAPPCSAVLCEEGQECVIYPDGDQVCVSDPCDPGPCADGEACAVQESFPPMVVCYPEGEEDPCDGSCTEFQECQVFMGVDGALEPYCADTCAPGACGDEGCILEETVCGFGPCPPVAVCTDGCLDCEEGQECVNYPAIGYSCALQSCEPNPCREGEECAVQESSPPVVVCYPGGEDDECEGRCGEFQECLIYTGPDSVSEPYCADTCAPGTCGDEEACNLEAVQCVRDPCPDVAVCSEPCSDCPENQECVYYPQQGYTCAYQSCDPNPCPEDDMCAVQESSPPVVVCYTVDDNCDGSCGEFQTCEIYTHSDGVEESYCADACAPGACGDEESCTLEQVQCVRAPCPPVAQCGPAVYAPPGTEYVGCLRDTRNDRVLQHKYDDGRMTNDLCLEHCKSRDAAYMATQYGYECFCYTTGPIDFDRHNNDEDPHQCDYDCQGDETQTCGGKWAFSLYKMDWPEQPTDSKEFVGCYRDTRDDRVMTDVLLQKDMTPTICRKHCYYKDAPYYATQYGNECWCGTSSSVSDYTKHGDGICHLPCAGDESIACGGEWAFDLFKIIE